jgi:Ca2+-binding RTX toxin-like protein
MTGIAGRWQVAFAAATAAVLLMIPAIKGGPPTQFSSPFSGKEGQTRAERAYGSLPLAFEPGGGRSGDADYVARSESGAVSVTGSGATLTLGSGKHSDAIGLSLIGALPAQVRGLEKLPGVVNDLRGDDPSRWRTGIPTFERIRYPGVYPGISLDWHGSQQRLEYDFRLAAGADPARIAIGVAHAEDLRIARNGDLVITAGGRTIRQRAPVAYQPADAEGTGRAQVPVRFALDGNLVRFRLGPYDHSRPLLIDPLILAYSTYLGGNGDDQGRAIDVDPSGAAYVTGETLSSDFDTVGSVEGDTAGSRDVFVSKLNPAGNALVYSTYLGGTGDDRGRGIAVDSSGAAYITGLTDSSDFNTAGPIESDTPGSTDAFITKLTPSGGALAYSTYLGGTGTDWGLGIAVDAGGGAYVTGFTTSIDFNPVGQYELYNGGGGADAFVSRLSPAGNSLVYSSFLGGSTNSDLGQGIAVDSGGGAYITGLTASSDFDMKNAIEGDSAGNDAFVSKFDTTQTGASSLVYSTYLGGDGDDQGAAIALDGAGAAYVTGLTGSSDFDTVNPIEGDTAGSLDAFISKLAPTGNALSYSTYLGGNADDQGKAIAVDPSGSAYVAGTTESSNFDTRDSIMGAGGGEDAFVSQLNPAGNALAFSTYLSGSGEDEGNGIAVDGAGAAYVTGHTGSSNFRTVGPIEGDSAAIDAFVSKLGAPAAAAAAAGTCAKRPATITGTASGETLVGTAGRDVISARGGNDKVKGLGGKDILCGGRGNDRIRGGNGNDRIRGGKGKDGLRGGKGRDKLRGGRGSDVLRGGPGKDSLRGGAGRDKTIQ